jgi:hypothetical protein
MDRYFFHLQAASLWSDEEGTELPDFASAKLHAVQYVAEHLLHKPSHFWDAETYEVRVTDGDDLTLLVVSLVATISPAASDARRSAERQALVATSRA